VIEVEWARGTKCGPTSAQLLSGIIYVGIMTGNPTMSAFCLETAIGVGLGRNRNLGFLQECCIPSPGPHHSYC
jgi:hypothetical protein